MKNKIYLIGDIVYIKRNLIIGKVYNGLMFLNDMAQDIGKPMRVIQVIGDRQTPLHYQTYYQIEEVGNLQSQWFVSAEMITDTDINFEFTADEVLRFLTE